MLDYIQELEYQWFEQSMNPDLFDDVNEFEEMEESEWRAAVIKYLNTFTTLMPTYTFCSQIIVSNEEQNMIVNALAFFHDFFKYAGDGYRKEMVEHWQDVADDSNTKQFDSLATKIATSN